MLSSIGQSIALASHLNAFLAGHPVALSAEDNPWFKGTPLNDFRVGDDPTQTVARSLDEWMANLSSQRFAKAYLWFEPAQGAGISSIQAIGFAGASLWAPVAVGPGVEVIWHHRVRYDPVARAVADQYFGGYRVMPGQHSLRATADEASRELVVALEAASEFQVRRRPEQPFGDMFHAGIDVLEGGPWKRERIDLLFPAGLYPETSHRLVGAVEEAWAFGGMGWWDDWASKDPDLQFEYEQVTKAYYTAMGKALFAACDMDLGRR